MRRALVSLVFFVLASAMWPLCLWLLSTGLKIPWPWGAAMLPLISAVALIAIVSTVCIFTVWTDSEPAEGE